MQRNGYKQKYPQHKAATSNFWSNGCFWGAYIYFYRSNGAALWKNRLGVLVVGGNKNIRNITCSRPHALFDQKNPTNLGGGTRECGRFYDWGRLCNGEYKCLTRKPSRSLSFAGTLSLPL
jgi:hypothetical protein